MEMRERGQATQSALIIAGSDGVAEVLAQLPSGRDARYRASELEGYALAISQMNPAPTAVMQAQLASALPPQEATQMKDHSAMVIDAIALRTAA